eukprot:gene18399-22020_t
MAFGCSAMAFRCTMLLAQTSNVRLLDSLLLLVAATSFSSYLWILSFWCHIIGQITTIQTTKTIMNVLKWTLHCCNAALLIFWSAGTAIRWPYIFTNMVIAFYGFGEAIAFAMFAIIIYREFCRVSKVKVAGLSEKMIHVVRLTSMFVVTSIVLTGFQVFSVYWVPKSGNEYTIWLFVSRGSVAAFNLSIVFFMPGHKEAGAKATAAVMDANRSPTTPRGSNNKSSKDLTHTYDFTNSTSYSSTPPIVLKPIVIESTTITVNNSSPPTSKSPTDRSSSTVSSSLSSDGNV